MAKMCAVDFTVRKDGNELVSICHGFQLHLFQVRCKFDSSSCINVNQHELLDKVVAKISQVGKRGCNFCEITDRDRAIDAQAVRFDEDFFFLKPCQKISIRASEFNVAKCAVAEHVATDEHVPLVLFFNAGRYLEKLLKCFFAERN